MKIQTNQTNKLKADGYDEGRIPFDDVMRKLLQAKPQRKTSKPKKEKLKKQ
ncbi:MAG: hypothetical protein ACRETW_12055 [Stenotrophobium sp.]